MSIRPADLPPECQPAIRRPATGQERRCESSAACRLVWRRGREVAAALEHEHHAPRLRQPLGDGDLDRPHETGVDHQRAVRQWRRRPVDRRRRRSLSTARGRWLLRRDIVVVTSSSPQTPRIALRMEDYPSRSYTSSFFRRCAANLGHIFSCRTRSTLKRLAAAIILSMTSSKSNSVDFENRIGLTRAMTNGLQIGAGQTLFLQRRGTRLRHCVVQLQHLCRSTLTLAYRFCERLVEEIVRSGEAHCDTRRHRGCGAPHTRHRASDRAPLRTRTHDRFPFRHRARRAREPSGSSRATSLSRCAPSWYSSARILNATSDSGTSRPVIVFAPSFLMACRRWLPFGVQVLIAVAHDDQGIQETADLLDDRHQPLHVRL